jgi:hypothetical protein
MKLVLPEFRNLSSLMLTPHDNLAVKHVNNAISTINTALNWPWAFIVAMVTNQMINAMDYRISFFAALMVVFLSIVSRGKEGFN